MFYSLPVVQILQGEQWYKKRAYDFIYRQWLWYKL